MTTELPEKTRRRWGWGTFFVALSAVSTLTLAGVAFWQTYESRKAAELIFDLSRQTGLAENFPSLIIESPAGKKGWKVPQEGIRVKNVGKGPAILLLIGFQYYDYEYKVPISNREYLTINTPPRILGMGYFIELEIEYQQQRLAPDPDPPFRRYYLQYADVFENEYRKHFCFSRGKVTSDIVEYIDKNSPKYQHFKKPPNDN